MNYSALLIWRVVEEPTSITREEFERFRFLMSAVLSALAIEEKFSYLVANHRELECEAFAITLDRREPLSSWNSGVEELHRVSRRIVNFLTTGKLYVDQVLQDLREIPVDPTDLKKEVRSRINELSDQSFAYRFVTELRNYAQHRSFPINGLGRDRELRHSRASSPQMLRCLRFSVDVKSLGRDNKFDSAIAKEALKLGDEVDIRPVLQEYLSDLAQLHMDVREKIRPLIRGYRSELVDSIHKFGDPGDDLEWAMELSAANSDEAIQSRFMAGTAPFERWEMLCLSNSDLSSIKDDVVTSRMPPEANE